MPVIQPHKFDGRYRVGTANDLVRLDRADLGGGFGTRSLLTEAGVTAADWFAHSHTAGGDTNQLQEWINAALTTITGVSTPVLSISNTTGRWSILNPHGVNAITVTFEGTLALFLGISVAGGNTGSIAAGATWLSPLPAYHIWLPDQPAADLDGDPALEGVIQSEGAVTVSPSGVVTTTKFFEHVLQAFDFEGLDRQSCFPLTATISNYEDFWQRVLSVGTPFRFYADRTVRSTAPFTYVAGQKAVAAGTSALKRYHPRSTLRYNLELAVHGYRAAT